MCSRFAEPGAGNPDERRPFRVQLRDIEGPAWWLHIPRAYGRNDARNQALEYACQEGEDVRILKIVEAPQS